MDLNVESDKILDDFKEDLQTSIGVINNKLSGKVDKLSLADFGKKVDHKISTEFQKKLDKNDLRKNNNIVNKKIDSLENKISKTLVDTLIDLQMDDQPLITKRVAAGEKCASCNQIKNSSNAHNHNHGNYNPMMQTSSYFNNSGHCNTDEDVRNFANKTQNNKFKFRNIQDNSNKYGTGSYSRILGNVDNINEEIGAAKMLPDISTKNANSSQRKNVFTSNNNVNTRPTLENTVSKGSESKNNGTRLKMDDLTEREYNTMINEELDKKMLNPDALIKNSNKIFDMGEKRNNNKSLNFK